MHHSIRSILGYTLFTLYIQYIVKILIMHSKTMCQMYNAQLRCMFMLRITLVEDG